MKLFRILLYVGPTVLFLLLLATPAAAQFEVSPDHFDNPPQAAATKPVAAKKQSTTAHAGTQSTVTSQTTNGAKAQATAKTNRAPGSAAKKTASGDVAEKTRTKLSATSKSKSGVSDRDKGDGKAVARK